MEASRTFALPPPSPYYGSSTASPAARLYLTATGHTRADRRAAFDAYAPAPPAPLAALSASNPAAKGYARPLDGPLIVTYVRFFR